MEGMLTGTEKINLEMDTQQPQQALDSGASDTDQLSQVVLGDLPEVCIAEILSCLPPREVAKLACVCRSFRAASNFDSVWERLLPPTYRRMLALDPDVVPAQFASKREVFDYLCTLVLFANNTQVFWLDRETGGACMSIGARGITIIWSDDNRYWDWPYEQNSLFLEVARLKHVCWFEASGEVECSLPPGAYTLSWRIFLDDLRGWRSEPAHFTLSKNDIEDIECKCYIDEEAREPVEQFSLPTIRAVENDWTEYDVGEFVVERGEQTCLLKFAMLAIHVGVWKSGLSMDGVVIRPTNTIRQAQSVTYQRGISESTRVESGFHTPEFQPEGPEFHSPEALRRLFTNLPDFAGSWTR